ncbi:hypothetical protein MNBD_ALPHA04-1257 [hydrothermal vent metagenome]|uniref:Serine aminopeptidase S33 domain-containing protein n=1 Tax=hydrothermal vent metagenome TaxID=652676 RepID=A0A3B0SB93_9ZZZZ
MTRSFHQIPCEGDIIAATIDEGHKPTGLLIVSGGNEIRSGAHAGMSRISRALSAKGFPVMRYDRRGVGDSSGENTEFLSSRADIIAASRYFRSSCPKISKVIAFGNCDAATALVFFGEEAGLDGLILANPWVIENTASDGQGLTKPTPSAVRSRYLERLKNPRTFVDLIKGNIDFEKLVSGLKTASRKEEITGLSIQVRDSLMESEFPTKILLAKRDTTALAFLSAWNSSHFNDVEKKTNIALDMLDSASHSFADDPSGKWLENRLLAILKNA